MFPPTTRKVYIHTCTSINDVIRDRTVESLNSYKDSSNEIISQRIRRLNYEWDTERVLEAGAALAVIASTILGLRHNRLWFLVTGAAGVFLLNHALQGWCPALVLLRRLGVRTAEEIFNERTVLKMMRGDFAQTCNSVREMLDVAEKQ